MKINTFLCPMILLTGLTLRTFAQQAQTVSLGDKHYLNAKNLIENNCVDCMGSTKDGMERGITEMQQALAAGFTDRKAAYKLLADGYNAMITFSGNNENERGNFEQQEHEAIGQVYRLDPDGSEFAVRYADTLKDNQERLAIYISVAQKDPLQTDAAFGAGMLLLQENRSGEGLAYVRKAIANEKDPESLLSHAQGIMSALQNQNCPLPDAGDWNEKFEQAFLKATQGEGDSTDMREVTRQFLQKLNKFTCKANP